MASTKVSFPKYRLHKGSGQAFIQIKGKRHYLGVYNSQESKEAYTRFLTEFTAKTTFISQPTRSADHLTVVELCAAYLDHARQYYQKKGIPTGRLDTITRVVGVVHSHYGMTPAEQFGPMALRTIQHHLISRKQSRRYINDQVEEIKRMFKWGASMELFSVTIYQSLATVPGLRRGRSEARETEPVKPVADIVINATLPYLSNVVADMVRFQWLTSARPGEVCLLRPTDVDQSGDVWEYRPASHKTEHHGKSRVVFIGPQAQAILRPYLERPAEAYCFSPAESEEKRHIEQRLKRQTKVQPSQLNRKKSHPLRQPKASYTKDSYRRAIIRAVEKANKQIQKDAMETGIENPTLLPAWHPNQLRHTAATTIRKQYGLEAAQVILGHSKADVTQIYAERDSEKAIEIIRKIG